MSNKPNRACNVKSFETEPRYALNIGFKTSPKIILNGFLDAGSVGALPMRPN